MELARAIDRFAAERLAQQAERIRRLEAESYIERAKARLATVAAQQPDDFEIAWW
jgi:hypothetical protein